MQTFSYVARDRSGKTRKGKSESVSAQALVQQLRREGLFVTEYHTAAAGGAKWNLSKITILKAKVKAKELMLFSRQFAAMVDAGMDLIDCLDILEDQSDNPTLREALAAVKADVMEGTSLSQALGKHPDVFDNLYVSMMEAAQTTGSYAGPLEDLATMLEKTEEIKSKVKSALRTPLMTLAFAVLMTLGLIKFAVPTFTKMYGDPSNLPQSTQVLISISDTIQGTKGLIILVVFIVLTVVFRQYVKTSKGEFYWHGVKLKIPIFGGIILKRSISLFSRTLSLLLSSGVDYLDALTIVANVADNRVIQQVLENARETISRGEDLADAFIESGIFPGLVTQMIRSGAATGRVPEMLGHISKIYEGEVSQSVENLTETLNPILTILLGILVGGVMIGLYMPVFSIGETLMQ
ncbi:MAG: type II secretion system F family protein [Candidatus Poribacteria bacterium]|nr:type II secretion system F family protein [Candidatus Poribacteria bacterium]